MLLTSSDQGKTWTQRTIKEREGSDLFQDRDLYAIRFAPGGKVGWIVGEDGIVMKSDDGGATWTRQDSGSKKNLFNVFAADDQQVVAIGADGTILRTADGGSHWQSVKSPKNVSLFGIIFLDKNTGYAVGEFSTILATTDGGRNWTLAYGGNTGDFTVGPYFSIAFSDPQHGIACGLAGDLLATEDGGKIMEGAEAARHGCGLHRERGSRFEEIVGGWRGRAHVPFRSGRPMEIDRSHRLSRHHRPDLCG